MNNDKWRHGDGRRLSYWLYWKGRLEELGGNDLVGNSFVEVDHETTIYVRTQL